ncbi:DNA ligase [Spirochaetia bacterium]|nr:DNA ligase [Spirochaetia bacterium]
MDRIAELEQLITGYQTSYYNDEAEITDVEFDALWDELKRIAPESPVVRRIGADDTDGFPKARHLIPMGSQEKSANPDEFCAWASKLNLPAFVVQYKLDGASLELQYENGLLSKAVTRGDGIIGDDISANARKMAGVRIKLDIPFTGGIRGEVLMSHSVWQEKYTDKANCRNAANGLMRRKDGSGCEDLTLIVYDAAASNDDNFFQTERDKMKWLQARGFNVVEMVELTTVDEIIQFRDSIAQNRAALPFDIDGLVVKDPQTDQTDLRRARPERQIAFKFELEHAISTLIAVEWNETGATYTPVAVIEAVRLAGTTVQRASLNNPDQVRGLGLRIGSKVFVVKRGEIIPKIEGVAPGEPGTEDIVIPVTCGTCGTALVDAGTRLYCPNPACPKLNLHRLQKWVNVLDIRELGDKLLRQLFDSGFVSTIPDLYSLTVEQLSELDRMGEKSGEKVIRNIKSPRDISLAAFVAGFDLDGVGELVMEKVVTAGFDTLEKVRAASVAELSGIYGLGDITAQTIFEGIRATALEMDHTLAAGIISIAAPAGDLPLRGLSFCFTGELVLMKRNAAEEKVKSLGASVKSSVIKGLSYLVTNDPESGSSKNQKAQKMGIPIVDEQEFLKIIGSPKYPFPEM